MQHHDELAGERATAEARQANLLQCESTPGASQAIVREWAEQQLPAFARASQNMAAMAALLTPSTDGVDEVYQWLKSILGTAAALQVESSLLY
jgi:hypothetical protein